MRIDLLWLTDGADLAPAWDLGRVMPVQPTPAAVNEAMVNLSADCDFVLSWDAALGRPDPMIIADMPELGGDVWHAGLRTGMAGLPTFLNYVNPSWRFTVDPARDRSATSWRLSLRASLVRAEVVRRMNGPNPDFESLAAASLEVGHRWITNGVLMRHVPILLSAHHSRLDAETLPLVDEFRFVQLRFGRQWARWALWRAWHYGGSLAELVAAYRASEDVARCAPVQPFHGMELPELETARAPTVSVLIPTLDRYPTLLTVLNQLREQTVAPLDIVVVDQTAIDQRDWTWPEQFHDLPLRVIWQDEPGQCSSRNAGLLAARGDAVLFLDDDDEIEPDLIERHLAFLQQYGVDASCGVAEVPGSGALTAGFDLVRDSDVFPTNNTLLVKTALNDSGLFDLAYERGSRADNDLGMRLYLAGKLLLLNPAANVVHLHAPRGGLRQHKARVVTSASSQASIHERHFLATTESYLFSRYFTPLQVHEAVLIRTFSSLGARGRGARRWVRFALMLLLLPDTYRRNRRSLDAGERMLAQYPDIPKLDSAILEKSYDY